MPNARETLFNRAHMIAAAQTCIEKDSEPKRVEFIVGDPFIPFPREEMYIYIYIFSNTGKIKCQKRLEKSAELPNHSMNNTSARLLSFDRPVKRT